MKKPGGDPGSRLRKREGGVATFPQCHFQNVGFKTSALP